VVGDSKSQSGVTVSIRGRTVPPEVYLDLPRPETTVFGTVALIGWALDNKALVGRPIGAVQVFVDGVFEGNANYGFPRPDVCVAFPNRPGCPNVGFGYSLDTKKLKLGLHIIRIVAIDTDATPDSSFVEVSATITTPPASVPPNISLVTPVPGTIVSGIVAVKGFAYDNDTSIGTLISSVQVLVDGVYVGNATYGLPPSGVDRPDICAYYPGRPGCPNVGYAYSLDTSRLSPGSHTIRVVAIDSDPMPDSGYADVTVTTPAH
jgi:hypothetical protein